MKKLIYFLFAITAFVAALVPVISRANELNAVIAGKVYHPAGVVLICNDKQDAIEALEAEDVVAALVKKQEEAKCRGFFDYFRVGNVVYVRNINDTFYRVVEITSPMDDGDKSYWITSTLVVKGRRT